jgi:hypothetical protein
VWGARYNVGWPSHVDSVLASGSRTICEVNSVTHVPSVFSARRFGRAASLAIGIALVMLAVCGAAQAFAVAFDPANVISDDNMRSYDCMSQADIQAFLNTQSGPLKSLVTTDYAGNKEPAAQIIKEACVKWHISPKVMLTMLQKEQSLLTRTTLVTGYSSTLDWAIGMGCPDSKPRIETYRGFGRQMWWGANHLDSYGEAWSSRPIVVYKAGMTYGPIKPKNIATLKLYVYNPSIGAKAPYGDLSTQSGDLSGNADFWWLYRKYFGDPFANPAKRPIYRFRVARNGAYIYTASQAERYSLLHTKGYILESTAFSWNTSATANSVPVYRFFNRKTRQYLFTASPSQTKKLLSKAQARSWGYQGIAFKVSSSAATSTAVYQFNNRKTGAQFLTPSTSDKKKYLSATYRKKWLYKGIPFYFAN